MQRVERKKERKKGGKEGVIILAPLHPIYYSREKKDKRSQKKKGGGAIPPSLSINRHEERICGIFPNNNIIERKGEEGKEDHLFHLEALWQGENREAERL